MHKILIEDLNCVIMAYVEEGNMRLFYSPYIAIIGDIKESRKLKNRNNVQNKLKAVLSKINQKYESVISAKFTITLGDEFQGLLCVGENVIDIIEEIRREMSPVQIRFGIGVGEITTDINSDMALGADGPGYYKAREAIEMLKRNEQKSKTQASDIRIEIEDDRSSVTAMLNTIFSLMAVIQNNWSDRQREIIWEFDKNKGSQSECAERMKISQSSVQRSLVNGNYYAYKEAKNTVNSVLREIGEVRV